MIFKLLSFSPVLLLSLFYSSNAQNVLYVEPGRQYFILSPNYPRFYPGGSWAEWRFRSSSPIELTCHHFTMPHSTNCVADALVVRDGNAAPRTFCSGDDGQFSEPGHFNEMTIAFNSAVDTPGGRFNCTIQAQKQCACGVRKTTKILGGVVAGVHEFPSIAALVNMNTGTILCGATIINEKQVLTAAHCTQGRNVVNTKIVVGEHDTSTGNEARSILHEIQLFTKHPSFNEVTYENDIAVITVKVPIQFNEYIGPACLPFQHSRDSFAGNYAYIVGWGAIQPAQGPSHVLMKAQVGVLTNSDCSKWYDRLTDRQLCTREPHSDSCQYDSGGPVFWQNPSTRRLVIIGVISAGPICGPGEPAFNTRVGNFLQWIDAQRPNYIQYCKFE